MSLSTAGTGSGVRTSIVLALQALRSWTVRQVLVAAAAGAAMAVLVGVPTVLIPDSLLVRGIPQGWCAYPGWSGTPPLTGMLLAPYVRAKDAGDPQDGAAGVDEPEDEAPAPRTGRMGRVGGVLAWFAVGCPVCNKTALLALGYAGAITWFAPLQPVLAIGALALTSV